MLKSRLRLLASHSWKEFFTKKLPNYIELMSMHMISDYGLSSFQEATYQQIWRDVMVKEYTSIMKNDIWDIVPKLEGKSIGSSKWMYRSQECDI